MFILHFSSMILFRKKVFALLLGLSAPISVLLLLSFWNLLSQDSHHLRPNFSDYCSIEGSPSTSVAPTNYKDYKINLNKAIEFIQTNDIGHNHIVYTTTNLDAMLTNSGTFLDSLSSATPPMKNYTIINCLDDEACSMCRAKHTPELCVYMVLVEVRPSWHPC